MSSLKSNIRLSAVLAGAALAVAGVASQPAAASDSVVVRDVVLTHNVAERMPTDSVDAFSAEDEVGYVFVRVSNPGAPTTVKVVWRRDNQEHGSVPLNIGTSSGWRTWSRTNLTPGNWQVEVVAADGAVLSRRDFTVGAQAAHVRSTQQPVNAAPARDPQTSHEPLSSDPYQVE
jgi:hypothetical protein